jgi:hypothetical protein
MKTASQTTPRKTIEETELYPDRLGLWGIESILSGYEFYEFYESTGEALKVNKDYIGVVARYDTLCETVTSHYNELCQMMYDDVFNGFKLDDEGARKKIEGIQKTFTDESNEVIELLRQVKTWRGVDGSEQRLALKIANQTQSCFFAAIASYGEKLKPYVKEDKGGSPVSVRANPNDSRDAGLGSLREFNRTGLHELDEGSTRSVFGRGF